MAIVELQYEASGRGNGWTEIPDWLIGSIEYFRGLGGNGITDCVGVPGFLTGRLDSSSHCSGALDGYWTPGHTNCASGWTEGAGIRLVINSTPRWTGYVETAKPVPGTYQDHTVAFLAKGWFEIAAMTRLDNLPVLVNKAGHEVFQTLIDSVPAYAQPRAIELDASLDVYPYTLDRTRDEQTRLREELVRLCLSGIDKSWEKGDGTLVYENRGRRVGSTASRDTFTTHHGFEAIRSLANIVNQATVTANPRIPGTPSSVMYSLNKPTALVPGEPLLILGPWKDPANPTIRVGAVTLVSLVSGTDYAANTAEDGSGTSLTASLTVNVGLSGNATAFTVTLGGSTPGFLTLLQQRGTPLLNYGATPMEAKDDDSIATSGLRPMSLNMPYQDDLILAQEAAQYIVFTRKGKQMLVNGFVRKVSLGNTAELTRITSREISDRITIVDAQSGVSAAFFIENIRGRVHDGYLETTWGLSPVDPNAYWYLGVVGKSELGETTRLGFGYMLGHTDIAHVDTHSDTAHTDVAHADTHTDNAHGDQAHGDGSGHGDTAHSDTAHSDTAHVDVAHGDNHVDDPFEDVPHGDSHGDTEHFDLHGDGAHTDHTDGSHSDVAHDDSHWDFAHADSHSDSAFVDETHEDEHTNVAHSDTAHSDVAFLDVAHNDATSHSDVAHSDAAHGDVAHVDTAHSDVTHLDTHGDVTHGDTN